MIRWLIDLLYGSIPVEFESAYSLDESIRRLSDVVESSFLKPFIYECAYGTVTESRVSIQRTIPLVRNSFKPFFIGSFTCVGGKVILTGKFTMAWFSKIWISIFLGSILIFFVGASIGVIANGFKKWYLLLVPIGMFLFGIAMVSQGKTQSKDDIMWLKLLITKRLST